MFQFTVALDFTDKTFFEIPDDLLSNIEVHINGVKTDQHPNRLSGKQGDSIALIATDGIFPCFKVTPLSGYVCPPPVIRSIDLPLPTMYDAQDFIDGKHIPTSSLGTLFQGSNYLEVVPEDLFVNNPQVTDINSCFKSTHIYEIPENLLYPLIELRDASYLFASCKRIKGNRIPAKLFSNNKKLSNVQSLLDRAAFTTIPDGLFINNHELKNVSYAFRGTDINKIPQGIFSNCPEIENFECCFCWCSRLTDTPKDLFKVHTKANNFLRCFDGSSYLTVDVQIGSLATELNVDSFASGTRAKGTVYCRDGSAAYTAFSTNSSTNVNVYTF